MKLFSLFILPTLSFFAYLLMPIDTRSPHYETECLVGEILAKTTKIIKARYPSIQPSGTGISMPGGPVRKLGLSFDANGPFTKEYIRKLIIEFAQELLHQINSNEKFRPHLIKYPFTIENVQIIIYNCDKKGEEVFDPEIGVADITLGNLSFCTYDPESEYCKTKNEFNETYAEALELLKKE